jgi:hypothetical protein
MQNYVTEWRRIKLLMKQELEINLTIATSLVYSIKSKNKNNN